MSSAIVGSRRFYYLQFVVTKGCTLAHPVERLIRDRFGPISGSRTHQQKQSYGRSVTVPNCVLLGRVQHNTISSRALSFASMRMWRWRLIIRPLTWPAISKIASTPALLWASSAIRPCQLPFHSSTTPSLPRGKSLVVAGNDPCFAGNTPGCSGARNNILWPSTVRMIN